jgi:hypothetical protein
LSKEENGVALLLDVTLKVEMSKEEETHCVQ